MCSLSVRSTLLCGVFTVQPATRPPRLPKAASCPLPRGALAGSPHCLLIFHELTWGLIQCPHLLILGPQDGITRKVPAASSSKPSPPGVRVEAQKEDRAGCGGTERVRRMETRTHRVCWGPGFLTSQQTPVPAALLSAPGKRGFSVASGCEEEEGGCRPFLEGGRGAHMAPHAQRSLGRSCCPSSPLSSSPECLPPGHQSDGLCQGAPGGPGPAQTHPHSTCRMDRSQWAC